MQTTTNYGLKKPEGNEFISIADLNENADKVDEVLKGLDEDKVDSNGGDIANTKVSEFASNSTQWPIPAVGESPKTLWGKVKKFTEDFKNWMSGVCLIGQIVNNCVTNNPNLPLSAAQGKALMDLYTVLNTKLNQIDEDVDQKADQNHTHSNYIDRGPSANKTWADQYHETGIYRHSATASEISKGNTYLPYIDIEGNVGDAWLVIAFKYNDTYSVNFYFQMYTVSLRYGIALIDHVNPKRLWFTRNNMTP